MNEKHVLNNENNPVKIYKELKKTIPFLQKEMGIFFNKIHKMDKPNKFWWLIAGEYAIQAQYLMLLDQYENRLLSQINGVHNGPILVKELSKIIIDIVGKDELLGVSSGLLDYYKSESKDFSLFIDDEEKHFKIRMDECPGANYLSFNRITRFLHYLHRAIIKIKYSRFFKIKSTRRDLVAKEFSSRYFLYLISILPKELIEEFPAGFVVIGERLVKKQHKWRTYLGLELNIFQKILLAISYTKFDDENICLIPHGSVTGELDIWSLFRFSLFENVMLSVNNPALFLEPKNDSSGLGILYCPIQLPWFSDIISLYKWRELIKIHQKVIEVLLRGVSKGKKIKIRTKDLDYLSDYSYNFYPKEVLILKESSRFEEIYNEYSTIVTLPYGTITAKCHYNNINYLAYHHPLKAINKSTYQYINGLPGVFNDSSSFIKELERVVDELPEMS
jgi:hypothetical protein